MLTRAPGTSIRSPPIDIHPAWFDEKSGGAARCSAIAGALGITQIRLARMPPASTPSLTVNEYIVVPPRVLFLLLKRHWCVSCRQLSRRLTPLPIEVPEKLGFRHLPARILLGYSICGSAVRAPPPYPPPHAGEGREGVTSMAVGGSSPRSNGAIGQPLEIEAVDILQQFHKRPRPMGK